MYPDGSQIELSTKSRPDEAFQVAAEARAFLLSRGMDLTGSSRRRPRPPSSSSRCDGRSDDMTIGPVQLLVLGFDKPDFRGEIIDEFERLRENDTVRVIDALVVFKDAEGDVAVLKGSQLSKDEAEEFGAVVGGLLGLGAGGEEGMEAERSRARRPRRTASTCSTRKRRGTSWTSCPTMPRPRSSCSSIGGRSGCATRSCAPAASHRRTLHQSARSDRDRPDLRGRGRGARRVGPRCVVRCSRRRNAHDASTQGRAAYVSAYVETDGRFAIESQAAPPQAAAPAPQDDMAQIQQLATMKDQGSSRRRSSRRRRSRSWESEPRARGSLTRRLSAMTLLRTVR